MHSSNSRLPRWSLHASFCQHYAFMDATSFILEPMAKPWQATVASISDMSWGPKRINQLFYLAWNQLLFFSFGQGGAHLSGVKIYEPNMDLLYIFFGHHSFFLRLYLGIQNHKTHWCVPGCRAMTRTIYVSLILKLPYKHSWEASWSSWIILTRR